MTDPACRSSPKVSCLMPIYNGGAFLREAIDSVLAQSFEDFELIAVNDGSTDDTPAILADFAARDSRIRVLSQPNGGIVSALNAGLALCCGDYIARMDADDVSLPGRFAFQVDYLDRHPGCVLVGGRTVSFAADSSLSRGTSGGWRTRTNLKPFPPHIVVSIHPLIMVRRNALQAIGGYRADFPHAEDYDLFIRLANFGTLDNPDVPVLFYRRHEGAISIRNVETQERSAARAEIDARSRIGLPAPPDWLVDAYVRMRIWRRYQIVDRSRAKALLPRAVADLLDCRPRALLSAQHWAVRLRIASSLARRLRG